VFYYQALKLAEVCLIWPGSLCRFQLKNVCFLCQIKVAW